MNDTFYFFSWQDINFLKSELLLIVAWLLAFCGLLLPKKQTSFFVPFSCVFALLANLGLLFFLLFSDINLDKTLFFWNDLFYQNKFTTYLKILISVSALFSIWIQYQSKKTVSEWFVILLGGVLSSQFLLVSANFFGIYVSLEMLSICGYLLVAFYDKQLIEINQNKGKLIASSFNYLVFGAVSSACLLYGFSWWYGLSGSFSIPVIFGTFYLINLNELNQTTFLIGFLLIGISFLFKLAAVPLHFWISEIYKNASSGTIFFLATIPKIAVTGILFFILTYSIHLPSSLQEIIFSSLSILGVLSALFGGFLAIQQTNFKRFFAYSGVSQVGFLILLLVYNFQNAVISTNGIIIFWIFYILSNAIVWKFCSELDENNTELSIKKLNSLPFIPKLILSIASLSLAGFPPLGGFLVKMIVIFVVYQNYQSHTTNSIYLLSLIGIGFATLIGFFYYLKIPYLLFVKSSVETPTTARDEITKNINYKISNSTILVSILLIVINVVLAVYAIRFL
jgi:proton-translocating NADH-quinone oxidoreductase chain N